MRRMYSTLHVTVNANGEVTAEFTGFEIGCR